MVHENHKGLQMHKQVPEGKRLQAGGNNKIAKALRRNMMRPLGNKTLKSRSGKWKKEKKKVHT